ncbi:MAG: hypothetical protein U0163_15000 [Gemmatimonadaceae bacterium]
MTQWTGIWGLADGGRQANVACRNRQLADAAGGRAVVTASARWAAGAVVGAVISSTLPRVAARVRRFVQPSGGKRILAIAGVGLALWYVTSGGGAIRTMLLVVSRRAQGASLRPRVVMQVELGGAMGARRIDAMADDWRSVRGPGDRGRRVT